MWNRLGGRLLISNDSAAASLAYCRAVGLVRSNGGRGHVDVDLHGIHDGGQFGKGQRRGGL